MDKLNQKLNTVGLSLPTYSAKDITKLQTRLTEAYNTVYNNIEDKVISGVNVCQSNCCQSNCCQVDKCQRNCCQRNCCQSNCCQRNCRMNCKRQCNCDCNSNDNDN